MMTPQKKIRSLMVAVIFLFVTNIVLLLFLLLGKTEEPVPAKSELSMVGSFLQDSIKFNQKQMDVYQSVRSTDFEIGKPAFESLKSAKTIFYKNIYTDSIPDSVINALADSIGKKQIAVDKHMLWHFKNLRRICTPQQLPLFDSTFSAVVEKVTSGRFRRHDNK